MITLGVVLIVLALIFHTGVLWTIGLILLIVGLILAALAMAGRRVGGRRVWY